MVIPLKTKSLTLNPFIINGTTASRSFSVIFIDTPRIISMLSQSVTPRAQRSLSTFEHAILPEQKESKSRINKHYQIQVTVFRNEYDYPSGMVRQLLDIYSQWFVLMIVHCDAKVSRKNPFRYLKNNERIQSCFHYYDVRPRFQLK